MAQGKRPRNVIGSSLARYRTQKEWSQAVLAAKCQLAGWDISRAIIAGIEGKTRAVADWELLILARVLGIHADELLPERVDWAAFPVPSEKTTEKRRRVLARVRAAAKKKP